MEKGMDRYELCSRRKKKEMFMLEVVLVSRVLIDEI
jgi:hypothetical protein